MSLAPVGPLVSSTMCRFSLVLSVPCIWLQLDPSSKNQSLSHGLRSGENLWGPCSSVYKESLDGVYLCCNSEDYAEEFQQDINRYTPVDRWDQLAEPGDGPEERLEKAGDEEELPHAHYPEDYVVEITRLHSRFTRLLRGPRLRRLAEADGSRHHRHYLHQANLRTYQLLPYGVDVLIAAGQPQSTGPVELSRQIEELKGVLDTLTGEQDWARSRTITHAATIARLGTEPRTRHTGPGYWHQSKLPIPSWPAAS
jgi:hypothetical protein